ncbi:hypothetical protein ACVFYP_24415 [Roseomonas sp. F4]
MSKPPTVSRPRLALALSVGAYPLITALLYLWAPILGPRPPWQTALVIVPQMIVGMIWGITPLVHRLFGRFLLRPAR